jgi:hypothetical protein
MIEPHELERARSYLVCQERGHTPSEVRTASNPPQDICRFCGTYYWYETVRTLYEGMGKPSAEAIAAVTDGG